MAALMSRDHDEEAALSLGFWLFPALIPFLFYFLLLYIFNCFLSTIPVNSTQTQLVHHFPSPLSRSLNNSNHRLQGQLCSIRSNSLLISTMNHFWIMSSETSFSHLPLRPQSNIFFLLFQSVIMLNWLTSPITSFTPHPSLWQASKQSNTRSIASKFYVTYRKIGRISKPLKPHQQQPGRAKTKLQNKAAHGIDLTSSNLTWSLVKTQKQMSDS